MKGPLTLAPLLLICAALVGGRCIVDREACNGLCSEGSLCDASCTACVPLATAVSPATLFFRERVTATAGISTRPTRVDKDDRPLFNMTAAVHDPEFCRQVFFYCVAAFGWDRANAHCRCYLDTPSFAPPPGITHLVAHQFFKGDAAVPF